MNALRCLFLGHPGWRETTIDIPPGSFGSQYMVTFGNAPAEIEASILHARAWRCVRCHKGKVTDRPARKEWDR